MRKKTGAIVKRRSRLQPLALGALASLIACDGKEGSAPCPPTVTGTSAPTPLRVQHGCELRGRELFVGDFETVETSDHARRTAWHLSCGSSTCGFARLHLDDADPVTLRAGQLSGGEARVEAMEPEVVRVVFGTRAEPEHLTVDLRAKTVRYRKDLSDGGADVGTGSCSAEEERGKHPGTR